MKRILGVLLVVAFAQGCTIAVNNSMMRFDSPEASGKLGKGYVGLGFGGSRDTVLVSNTVTTPPSKNVSHSPNFYHFPFIQGIGLAERLDLEIRAPFTLLSSNSVGLFANYPYLLRGKFQFIGKTRAEEPESGFSLAAVLGAGWNSVGGSGSGTSSVSVATSASLLAGDAGLVAGYRVAPWFMPYMAASYSVLWVTGTLAQTVSSTTTNYALNESVHQTGLNLGLQFDVKAFFTKVEGGANFAVSSSVISWLPTLGVMIGVQW